MIPSQIIIRGTQVAYYYICWTKLWLFTHMITMEHNNELVKEGSLIHEISYSRDKKEININNEISLDIIKLKDSIEIREIKKSPKLEKAHILQMKYYMYYLQKRGIKVARGVILYPLKKKLKIVEKVDFKEIENIIEKIEKIVLLKKPPTPKRKVYCKSCSYYELCFG